MILLRSIRRIPKRAFSLSPLDDRYHAKLVDVNESFSEMALMRERVNVEIRWLVFLLDNDIITADKLKVSKDECRAKLAKFSTFGASDYEKIKAFEKKTNHDIKAVEYYIKAELDLMGFDDNFKEYTHFLCTSEDINNIAYSLLLNNFKENVYSRKTRDLILALKTLAKQSRDSPMLSRTHGQPATPTTMGKEIANFAVRLNHQHSKIEAHRFMAKMNGAVGNYNAHYVINPDIDWLNLTKRFIEEKCDLRFNYFTTQIEPHDSMCEYFAMVNHFNTIALGFSQDMWGYISRNYFKLKVIKNETGSSIMPHKVNPIDYENAEGNLGTANALLEFFNRKLPISRFQRDLSDSTVLRNIGVSMGHSVLAYQSLLTGISKLESNKELMKSELDSHFEILAEPIQQILRNKGYQNAYEHLKEFSRGKNIYKTDLDDFITSLPIDIDTKHQLKKLKPSDYIGIAPRLVDLLDDMID